MTKDTHLLLGLRTISLGLGELYRMSSGPLAKYAPVLHKVVFSDQRDWGVWHMHADIHLGTMSIAGVSALESFDWNEVV